MSEQNIADLINGLFRSYPRPDGREYTNKEVCEALQQSLQESHLSRLRKGKIPNPSRETILALCQFFKVPASYFFPELYDDQVQSNPDVINALFNTVSIDIKQKVLELIQTIGRDR
ncbi:helix-turn-helix domain-containing protein [Herpetosiphon geysericola]|uniref:helix-turn-helix domain-containing protein n=1 Tax=Herpetosiphon geysericola TaxID=70996 RepID=UPI0006C93A9A|nr:helix-turn-helix transcriptional regulator [Herpetosiphon geysericola]